MNKRESTENLERGTIILLKSWEEHKSINQEKVSLKDYERLMKSICHLDDFRTSEKLLNIFLEFSKNTVEKNHHRKMPKHYIILRNG